MLRIGTGRKAHSTPAEPLALQVVGLSAGYAGNRHALDGASFCVEAGERVAVIGPNGAGKSTLFKAIVGTLPFTSGHISVYGEDCYHSHSHVGYVPQQNAIDWSFPVSVFDVVLMGRSRHIGWFRLPSRSDRALVRDILEHLGLAGLAQRQISELSGGQRRRVFIARALAQEARLMVLDEPFAGVDQGAEQEIIESLDVLTQQNITVLLSTHHMAQAGLRFDKVLLLKRKVLAFGVPETVLTRERLLEAYGPSMPVIATDVEWPVFGAGNGHGSS